MLVEVTVCVGGFPVYVVMQGAVRISEDANIKERDPAVFFYFHRKLDAGVAIPQIIIHIAEPQAGLEVGAAERRGFMKMSASIGERGDPICLLVQFTLKFKTTRRNTG